MNELLHGNTIHRELTFMAKLIIEPKKGKDGQIDYIVTYHDVKSDNQFMVTTTNNLDEAVQRLKETLASDVQELLKK
jgi:hypothetical protein